MFLTLACHITVCRLHPLYFRFICRLHNMLYFCSACILHLMFFCYICYISVPSADCIYHVSVLSADYICYSSVRLQISSTIFWFCPQVSSTIYLFYLQITSNWFSAGYYCPTGSVTDTEVICPKAMYCATGSPAPVKCEAGTYTDLEGAETCEVCPAGYYCIPELIVEGVHCS